MPHDIKIVLAHDSFTQAGGAERVFLAMAELFPDAPIYTVVADKKILSQLPESVRVRIRTSPLQWLYTLYPNFQHLLPFIPLALRLTRLPKCSILLSSSSGFAKGFVAPGAVHINYCHTPTRFLWSESEYVEQEVPWLVRLPARIFLRWMKRWDYAVSNKLDVLLANSVEVQKRIQQFYDRASAIVYPFVDTTVWYPTKKKQDYFLIAGRLHAHKQNDMVIRVCNKLRLPVHVVGQGRDEEHLRAIAGPTITFLGRVSDEVLRDEFSGARAYMYPQLEDFGLMPLEAAACGTPTIGLNKGGALETVVPGVTGELFDGSEDNLEEVMQGWDAKKYSITALREHAARFSKDVFTQKILDIVQSVRKE